MVTTDEYNMELLSGKGGMKDLTWVGKLRVCWVVNGYLGWYDNRPEQKTRRVNWWACSFHNLCDIGISFFKRAKQPKLTNCFIYVSYWLINKLHDLCNPEVQCRIHKGSPIIPILSRINPFPRIDTYFFKVHTNTSYFPHNCLPEGLFSVGLTNKILKTLSSSILATWPAYLNLLDLITLTLFGLERGPPSLVRTIE